MIIPTFRVSTTCVVAFRDTALVILRSELCDLYPLHLCFPGGFKEDKETLHECASREVREETGIIIDPRQWDIINSYSGIDHDPRGENVNLVMLARLSVEPEKIPMPDGVETLFAGFVKKDNLHNCKMAFNHNQIALRF